ncbi:MAG: VOC family protein [Planctomycetia bacterium]|nr:VOC family protein [Planctomycetia bacterium]
MPSHFCWHELRTPDRKAARAFYGALFPWTITDQDMGAGGVYTDIAVAGRHLGGLCEAVPGAPPHWVAYVTTDDVDAAAARVTRSRGRVLAPPTDIPGIGRFACVSDPEGGVFCLWKGLHPANPDGPFAPGAFCWNELLAHDVAGAKRFYGEVLGWTSVDMPVPGMGTYTLWKSEGTDVGGLMQKPAGTPGPAAWIGYVQSADVDASAAKVKSLGGRLWVEPADIPNVGRFSVCADPAGATFALYKSAPRA